MAYNSSKGPQTHGDVKYEGDAEDTQIDFENDFVAIKTNGVQRLIVSSNTVTSSVPISCSHGITASNISATNLSGSGALSINQIKCSGSVTAVSFVGDGSGLTGLSSAAISTYNTSGDNRIITSVNSTTVQGEENLTFDGETLNITGDLTAVSYTHLRAHET